jgi:hypothetical protein
MVPLTKPQRVAADLSPAELLRAGGWHAAYARVLRVERDGDVALVLVDGNGDGVEVEEEAWFRSPEGWECWSSSGFGPLDGAGSSRGGSSGLVWAAGHAAAGSTVTVEYHNELHQVAVDEYGLWAFARFDQHADVGELPQRWDT